MADDAITVTQDELDAEAAFDQHIVKTIGWTKFASMQSAESGADYSRGFKAGYHHRTTSLAAQDGLVEALRAALYRLTVAAEEDMNRDEPEGVDGSEIDAANTAILNSYPQVFTDEQVAKLTEWQECDLTHSLTCPNGPHGFHDEDGTPLPDDLFAHCNGLFCPHCNYRQDWAPEVCFGPLPELPATFQASLSAIRENKS